MDDRTITLEISVGVGDIHGIGQRRLAGAPGIADDDEVVIALVEVIEQAVMAYLAACRAAVDELRPACNN